LQKSLLWLHFKILHLFLHKNAYELHVYVGVGTRNYYRKMGYELEGPYMTKLLNPEVHNLCVP